MGQGELPLCDAAAVVKVLEKFGYAVAPKRGKGSHIVLEKAGANTLTVPGHKPVKRGTLSAILEAADISVEDFSDTYKPKKGRKRKPHTGS